MLTLSLIAPTWQQRRTFVKTLGSTTSVNAIPSSLFPALSRQLVAVTTGRSDYSLSLGLRCFPLGYFALIVYKDGALSEIVLGRDCICLWLQQHFDWDKTGTPSRLYSSPHIFIRSLSSCFVRSFWTEEGERLSEDPAHWIQTHLLIYFQTDGPNF